MKKTCAGIVFVFMTGILAAGMCVGGSGPRDHDGDPDQVRAREWSCRDAIQWKGDVQILLTGEQTQDQAKDCDDCDDCDGDPDRIRDRRAHDDEETLFLPEWIMI